MKLIVSGWPGAGSSTLAMLLAYTYDYKLVRGSEIFRYLGKTLNFENTGMDRIKADEYIGDHFNNIYDDFIDYMLKSEKFDNFVVDSDISGFRVGKQPNVFSIFLMPFYDERIKRLGVDSRDGDIELLKFREEERRRIYMDFYNIDIFSEEQIKQTHTLPLENSKLSIAEELKLIDGMLRPLGINSSEQNFDGLDKLYWEKGKTWVINELQSKNLLMSVDDFISELNKIFHDRLEQLPADLRQVLLKNS